MKIKATVDLRLLTPQMVLAAMIVEGVYERQQQACSTTITSANDSKHGTDSLHYQGCALDFRTKDFIGDKTALLTAVRESLGAQFDCLIEDLGLDNEHLHIEWDPK